MNYVMILFILMSLVFASPVKSEETPIVRSVAVMFKNGDIKLGYISDPKIDESNNVLIAGHKGEEIRFVELYPIKYPKQEVCQYSGDNSSILLSSVSAIGLYKMEYDNLDARIPWTAISRKAIVMLQEKPLAQYHYDRGGGCRVFVLSYNPEVKSEDLESLFNTKVMDTRKADVKPSEILKLEKDNIFTIWRCWY